MDSKNRPATYQDLVDLKEAILNEIRSQNKGRLTQKWLKSKDVRDILGISPCTLQTMRNNDQIPFTRIGGVIYYQPEAIDDYMKSLSNKNGR